MSRMRSITRVGIWALCLIVSGCGFEQPARLLTPPAQPVVGRPADGLLQNPRLQEVVDRQVQRDGAALIELLGDGDAKVRARAAFSLASVIDPAAGPALVRSLEDADLAVRRDAAFALGQFGTPVLASVVRSATPVREAMLDMLSMITDPNTLGRLATGIQRTDAFGRDQRLGRATVEIADLLGVFLLGRLEMESEPGVREVVIEAASKLGDAQTLEAFVTMSPSQAGDVRAAALAVAYLSRRGVVSTSASSMMAQYLEHPDPAVRNSGASAFANIRNPLVRRAELAQVRGTIATWSLNESAAELMVSGIAGSGLPSDHPWVIRYLREGADWRTRAEAAEALGEVSNRDVVRAALMAALSDDSHHVGIAAAKGLSSRSLGADELALIKAWIEAHPNQGMVAGHFMPAFFDAEDFEYIVDWVRRFPTTEAGPWVLGLESFTEGLTPNVIELFAEAAQSPTRALGVSATTALAQHWPAGRSFPSTHVPFYEALKGAFETGDPERMRIAAGTLRDPILLADRADVVGDFDGATERLLLAPLEVDWVRLEALGSHPRLVLDTDRGRIVLTLDTEEAPLTVQWMTHFASEGRFDGVPFHRVEQNFVIQGGSFGLSDEGESVAFRMMTEATQIPYRRGTLGMARTNRRHTESSEFFVNHTAAPHLNGGYTAWGWVSEGIEVVDRIRRFDRILRAWVLPDVS